MIRPLIIDEAIKAQAKKIIDWAEQHHYIPYLELPPGDKPEHVLVTEFGYRCVFSFTEVKEGLFRDLSVSVFERGKYPNEFAFYTIAAELFGFTGWDGVHIMPPPEGWMIDRDINYPAIRVVQLLKERRDT